jgi:hypothetical protein
MLVARPFLIGAIAQLGERVLCKHEVVGSIPSGSTIYRLNVRQRVLQAQRPAPPAILHIVKREHDRPVMRCASAL